jgi:hypothetical protein
MARLMSGQRRHLSRNSIMGIVDYDAGLAQRQERRTMVQQGVAKIAVTVNGRQWKPVSSFRSTGQEDAVFMLNSKTGRISFGDGIHGAIPSVGSTVTVSYRQGGGSTGNISKKIYGATDVTQFRVIVRDRAQVVGWGNRRI